MKEYISLDTRQLRKSTRIAAIVAGVLFIGLGIIRPSIYAGLIGAVIIAAMLLHKETVVCKEGIVVRYDAVLYKYREVWPWEEIEEIHKELSPDCKQYGLHFMKDIMSKKLVFPISEAKEVLEFAKEMNPEIHIGNVNQ